MKLLGLIGFPLTHSFSRQYFMEKFEKMGLKDWSYEEFPIENITQLPALVESKPGLVGLNVTIPYKQAVIPLLDETDATAKAVGAANTIRVSRREGKPYLEGFNTDAYGFEESLKPLLQPRHSKALVLGTGGASKAVQHVLDKLKIPYRLVSRSRAGGAMGYADIDKAVLGEHKLIINTTPLGMYPDTAGCPDIPYDALDESHLLYDLVYNPAETVFLEKGRMQGAGTHNGLEMLYLQAEKAWEIWNGNQ